MRLANLFHKFVAKMRLHVLYFPLDGKRITKRNPPLGVEQKLVLVHLNWKNLPVMPDPDSTLLL